MELVPIVRVIWRRRLLLAVGLVVAVAVAVAIGASPPAPGVVAWTRVDLDTPTSQLVESAPAGAETLAWRTSLLAHLTATDSTRRQLARQLGVRPDEVTVVDPALGLPEVPASMPSAVAEAAAQTVAPYVLTVQVESSYLPVISIHAAAPDAAGARRLAAAAVAILESRSSASNARYSSMIRTGGGAPLIPQPFLVRQVAPIRAKPVAGRAMPIKGIGVAVLLFGVWSAVLLVPALVRWGRPRVSAGV